MKAQLLDEGGFGVVIDFPRRRGVDDTTFKELCQAGFTRVPCTNFIRFRGMCPEKGKAIVGAYNSVERRPEILRPKR